MLCPSEPDEHPKARLCREVEQPTRRWSEGAHTVRAEAANRRKIAFDLATFGKRRAMRADAERPIRHATNEDLLTVVEEELASHSRPASMLDLGGFGDGRRPRHDRQIRFRHGSEEVRVH